MTELIRVDKNIYKRLHQLAGRLQLKAGEPVSANAAIAHLFRISSRKNWNSHAKTPKPVRTAKKLEDFEKAHDIRAFPHPHKRREIM